MSTRSLLKISFESCNQNHKKQIKKNFNFNKKKYLLVAKNSQRRYWNGNCSEIVHVSKEGKYLMTK